MKYVYIGGMSTFANNMKRMMTAYQANPAYYAGVIQGMNRMTDLHGLPRHELTIYPHMDQPFVTSDIKPVVGISNSLLPLMGVNHPATEFTPYLGGLLGHEMYHCATNLKAGLVKQLTYVALPAFSVMALYLIERALAKAPKAPADVAAQIEQTTEDDVARDLDAADAGPVGTLTPEEAAHAPFGDGKVHGTPLPQDSAGTARKFLDGAKYLAAAAVGYGIAAYAVRRFAMREELRADAFGAKLAGTDHMIEALKRLHGNSDGTSTGARKRIGEVWHHPHMPVPQKLDESAALLQHAWHYHTVGAHPSLQERVNNLMSLSR